jgi:hypothetical protein
VPLSNKRIGLYGVTGLTKAAIKINLLILSKVDDYRQLIEGCIRFERYQKQVW